MDRRGGRGRHAGGRPSPVRRRASAGLRPPAGHHGPGVLARRSGPRRGRVPRGPALEVGRVRADRPADRPGRADRVGPFLAGRQETRRDRRPARPDGRDPGLGRRGPQARPLGPHHLRHRLRCQLVARRDQDRRRLRRQLGPRGGRQDRRPGPLHGLAQRLGARHRVLGRRLELDLGRPRHDGQAHRGRDPAVRRQHHLDHPGGPERRTRRRRQEPEAG